MNSALQLLLIADSDSQLLACEALCRGSRERTVAFTINVIPRDGTPKHILKRLDSLGSLWNQNLGQLLNNPKLLQFDAIGVFLTGSKLNDIRLALERHPIRPKLFCGFNGVVLEHFIEGISWRLGYDLICLSGPRDRDALNRLVANTPFADQHTVLTGLQRNSSFDGRSKRTQRPKRLVFAEQVVMPATTRDRAEMVQILADLATRSPNWEVLIKPRIAPGDATFHDVDIHISTTLRQTLGVPPTNLKLDYRPLPDLLRKASLMATISSTAFFDALDFGCRPVAMNDLGLHANHGSHVFAGSGVWRSLRDVVDLDALDRELTEPNGEWLDWMGYSERYCANNLFNALEALQRSRPTGIKHCGYPTNTQSSFNQLRVGAEAAICTADWRAAEELLCQAAQMRPQHRGVRRRLAAVSCQNPLLRWIGLILSYRDLG
jgi:hypothetical protein